jgi:hypothetical protein
MKRDDGPTYEDTVEEILSAAGGPLMVDKLVDEVLARKATASKNPRQLVRSKLREFAGHSLVYVDADHVLAVPLAYKGARFRIRLDHESIDQGTISANNFDYFLPSQFELEKVQLVDRAGTIIPFQVKSASHEEENRIFGTYTIEKKWIVLKEWFRRQKMYHKDHLLVTVEDWERGVFRLEREAFGQQHPEQIAERDAFVANMFFDMLESARQESVFLFISIPTLYACLPDKAGCPPDHWRYILQQDERMKTDGFEIRYAESHTLLDDLIKEISPEERRPKPKPEKKLAKGAHKEVYRFHAAFKHRPSIWRDIEIQGEQTLMDLDRQIRLAFNHDTYDHLSGFWKLVLRGGGKKNRYREIAIGNIDPFGGGEAADLTIASLELKVEDSLKHIYDFGDWIEHTLTLSAVIDPQPGMKYPREAARNKPKYQYCDNCKEQGKQTVATWICFTCSEAQGKDVLLCEECIGTEQHEDHYSEELVY